MAALRPAQRRVHRLPGDRPAFPGGRPAWWAETSALPAGIVGRGGDGRPGRDVPALPARLAAPTWLDRLLPYLDPQGVPPSATAAPERRLARARTGSELGPAAGRTSPRRRPGRPAPGPPCRPRPRAAPSAAGRRLAAGSGRGIPGPRGRGPARPGPRRRLRPRAVPPATGRCPGGPGGWRPWQRGWPVMSPRRRLRPRAGLAAAGRRHAHGRGGP